MSRARYVLKSALFHLPLVALDGWNNAFHATHNSRILVTRYSGKRAYTFRDFLAWVSKEVPELRSRLEFHRLPCRVRDWSRYVLHTSWAGDGLDLWSPPSFRRAVKLADECRSRGIPVLNPIEHLPQTGKSRSAALLRAIGIRTPRCVRITDPARLSDDLAGLNLPLLIREDRGHGQPFLKIESHAELQRVDFAKYREPVAAEFIDTHSFHDGLFRKYRYVIAGDVGVPRHMIANDHWEVRPERRRMNDTLRAEELAYVNAPDPHHASLQAARRALGLDIVGFDYSLDRSGQLIVWEANAFLNLNYPKNTAARHIFPAVLRSFAAIARLYLVQAGAPIPAKLVDLLGDAATHSAREPVEYLQSAA